MKTRKIISLFLAMVMMFSIAVTATAADSEPGIYEGEIRVEEGVPIHISNPGFDVSQIKDLPVQTKAAASTEVADKVDADEKPHPAAESRQEISLEDAADATPPARTDNRQRGNYDYYGATFPGSIPQSGQEWYLYPIELGHNELLQAKLNVPVSANVDYDLELYAYGSDGYVNWSNRLDYSYYGTDSNYFPERVGTVNATGSTAYYIVVVTPAFGYGSAYNFTVDISITMNGAFDEDEADENIFSSNKFGTVTPTQNGTIQMIRSISAPLDDDWFELPVSDTNTTEFEVYGLPSNLVAEIYTIASGSMKVTKRGSTETSANLPIAQGYNYIRIAHKNNVPFNYTDYIVTMGRPEVTTPVPTATKYYAYIAVNGFCQRYSTQFADKKARGLYLTTTNCEAKVVYLDNNNVPVNVNDSVYFEVWNPKWADTNTTQNPYNSVSITNQSQCIVPLRTGSQYSSTGFEEVYTTVISENYGYLITLENMALIKSYNDADTSKPCRHSNKACGYK